MGECPYRCTARESAITFSGKRKDKAFARSVDRACIDGGGEALGRPLEEHIAFVIAALVPIAEEIGL